jgi:hypothetical protein
MVERGGQLVIRILMSTGFTPGFLVSATATRLSTIFAANTPGTRMVTGSARSTSTPWRVSDRFCDPGCSRTATSRWKSCRSISGSSSSSTMFADAGQLIFGPSAFSVQVSTSSAGLCRIGSKIRDIHEDAKRARPPKWPFAPRMRMDLIFCICGADEFNKKIRGVPL